MPAWFQGRGGQPEGYCHRQMLDAIRYLVAGEISWRAMPADFPVWRRVYAFFRRWHEHGAGLRVPCPAAREGEGARRPRDRAHGRGHRRAAGAGHLLDEGDLRTGHLRSAPACTCLTCTVTNCGSSTDSSTRSIFQAVPV
ncbi:transposase [Streptomyces sp. NPDC058391]|uniref:transposase n=1 Tax=Streptomyces sp. NPDC058391 TaxID=3346476 RepID=UPI003653E201